MDSIADLQSDLNPALVTRRALRQAWQQVSDIIPRMPIQAGPETLLIQIMRNQANASTKNEQPIEHTHAHIVFGLLRAKGTTVAHEVNEANSDSAVNVKNEIVLLTGSDGFDGDRVIEHFAAWKALLDEFFDKLNTKIGVVTGFHFVTNSRNCDD